MEITITTERALARTGALAAAQQGMVKTRKMVLLAHAVLARWEGGEMSFQQLPVDYEQQKKGRTVSALLGKWGDPRINPLSPSDWRARL